MTVDAAGDEMSLTKQDQDDKHLDENDYKVFNSQLMNTFNLKQASSKAISHVKEEDCRGEGVGSKKRKNRTVQVSNNMTAMDHQNTLPKMMYGNTSHASGNFKELKPLNKQLLGQLRQNKFKLIELKDMLNKQASKLALFTSPIRTANNISTLQPARKVDDLNYTYISDKPTTIYSKTNQLDFST